MQQLEAAKQAAVQTRHQAGQGSAQSRHEAAHVQQVQGENGRLAQDVQSWKKQCQEHQVWLHPFCS